jgi:hypothetical protein
MVCVLPGLPEIFASPFLLTSIFNSDDFPTFDLPMKAYSGREGGGHWLIFALLVTKEADLIIIPHAVLS